jgi:hypothetical protein
VLTRGAAVRRGVSNAGRRGRRRRLGQLAGCERGAVPAAERRSAANGEVDGRQRAGRGPLARAPVRCQDLLRT